MIQQLGAINSDFIWRISPPGLSIAPDVDGDAQGWKLEELLFGVKEGMTCY